MRALASGDSLRLFRFRICLGTADAFVPFDPALTMNASSFEAGDL
jgi:hypothetical protein